MRKMARNLKENTELNKRNRDEVMNEGAFRHSLPYWKAKYQAGRNVVQKYSSAVHTLAGEEGPYVKDTEGNLYNPKLVNAVPVGSKDVRVPKDVQTAGLEKRTEARERLWAWARQIHAWLKQREPTSHLEITQEWKDMP